MTCGYSLYVLLSNVIVPDTHPVHFGIQEPIAGKNDSHGYTGTSRQLFLIHPPIWRRARLLRQSGGIGTGCAVTALTCNRVLAAQYCRPQFPTQAVHLDIRGSSYGKTVHRISGDARCPIRAKLKNSIQDAFRGRLNSCDPHTLSHKELFDSLRQERVDY